MSRKDLPVQSDLSVELEGEDVPLNNIQLATKEEAYHRLVDVLLQFADLDPIMCEYDPEAWQQSRLVDDWLVRHKHDDRTTLGEYRWKCMEMRRIYDDFSLWNVETPLEDRIKLVPEGPQAALEPTISSSHGSEPVQQDWCDPGAIYKFQDKSEIYQFCEQLREPDLSASIVAHDPVLWQKLQQQQQWLWQYECDPKVKLEEYQQHAQLLCYAYAEARRKCL